MEGPIGVILGAFMGAVIVATMVIGGHNDDIKQQKRECSLMNGAWYTAPAKYVFPLTGDHRIWVYSEGVCITDGTD